MSGGPAADVDVMMVAIAADLVLKDFPREVLAAAGDMAYLVKDNHPAVQGHGCICAPLAVISTLYALGYTISAPVVATAPETPAAE